MSDIKTKDLKEQYEKIDCKNENFYTKPCNHLLLKKESIENTYLKNHPEENDYLYPSLSDSNFNVKIANKKEFNDTKYDGKIYDDIKKQADILAKADFELSPHQAFVKNFMSYQTPYNSLLLYHGLGSGKTCSAIGVCEEMRDYMKQMNITKRIIIVASENVQDNFRLQLFDERKLKLIDGVWNIRACIGNKLLQDVNPMNMKGIPKDKIISQIKNVINSNYIFLGYGQFANYIIKTMNYTEDSNNIEEDIQDNKYKKVQKSNDIQLNKKIIKRLQTEFNDRLIVIDEVHNIRKTDDNENKKVAINLELLVKSAENMRFLLLSATPMYNTYKEIVWLLNLMNTNDRRGRIEAKDIFEKNGSFKKGGEDLLIKKATGYISFVRGENPYTFPYRIYPNEFAKNHTFSTIKKGFVYPSYQMNLKRIKNQDKKRILSLYLNKIGNCNKCGVCQYCCYRYIIYNLRNKNFSITTKTGVEKNMPTFENMESFGYTLLQIPLESLIISYPIEELKEIINALPNEKYLDQLAEEFKEENIEEEELGEENIIEEENPTISEIVGDKEGVKVPFGIVDPHILTGKKGIERMMNFKDEKNPPYKGEYEYKQSTLQKYGRIFSQEKIGLYSSKIKCILDNIFNPTTGEVSEGIILIYSQYIDSGLIPMALALEEMGFIRYSETKQTLFKDNINEPIDVKTMKPSKDKQMSPAKYSMITGDTRISPNNDFEVKGITNENNVDGSRVKVILISKAGSEGIDLKYIRQVHILEPWYNMNRIEQIIGRAVRNFSHKDLEFEKRNVEIFMYGTILEDENKEEAADLYVYRIAEFKAIQIGNITRILKESAVDCLINHEQTNFTQEIMNANLKEPIKQILSDGQILDNFKIGDAPFSPACDYMAKCNYLCRPNAKIDENNLNEDTYNEKFIMLNSEKILQRIRMLFKDGFFYKKDDLINLVQIPKNYPIVQIYAGLTKLIDDNNEFIVDKYGRNGRLINIGEYYLFQPIELKDKNSLIFDRSVPIDYKHESIVFDINKNIKKVEENNEILNEINEHFQMSMNYINNDEIIIRGDDNWYKHCGVIIKRLREEDPDMEKYLISFLVAHIIETLLYDDKLYLMNYLYSLKKIEKNTFHFFAKEYFDSTCIVTKKFKIHLMFQLNKQMIMILNKENKWVLAGPTDQKEIMSLKETQEKLNINNLNKIIGFIGYEKSNKFLIFKTKNMESKRDTGARCDDAGKIKIMATLNEIIGKEKYTNEYTKKKVVGKKIISEAINNIDLCIIQEFTFRYYDEIQKNGKKWYLSPEIAIYKQIYKIIE